MDVEALPSVLPSSDDVGLTPPPCWPSTRGPVPLSSPPYPHTLLRGTSLTAVTFPSLEHLVHLCSILPSSSARTSLHAWKAEGSVPTSTGNLGKTR